MGKKRLVQKMSSVFELSDCRNPDIKMDVSGRVMFRYDATLKEKEFILLNKDIPDDLCNRILSWLDQNVDLDNSLFN